MKNKFNDFSALKALKKDLEENNTSGVASLPKKRSRTVVHKPKEQMEGERVAKERGLRPGCTVTLMDSNDRGILRHVHNDCVEEDISAKSRGLTGLRRFRMRFRLICT